MVLSLTEEAKFMGPLGNDRSASKAHVHSHSMLTVFKLPSWAAGILYKFDFGITVQNIGHNIGMDLISRSCISFISNKMNLAGSAASITFMGYILVTCGMTITEYICSLFNIE